MKLAFSALFVLTITIFSGNIFAQSDPIIVPLWEKGAPGFEDRKDEPEQAADWWVKNVHNPKATVYLPDESKANGAAVLIFPGGGHRELVIDEEGTKAAKFLNEFGVTGIVIKYRLAREEGSPYSLDTHTPQDAHRAIRLVKAHAEEWGLDKTRIGVMGFSAGGETVAMIAYANGDEFQVAGDEIDRYNSNPSFQILVYPGPLLIPEKVNENAPPLFAISANDDECCSEPVFKLLKAYREAGVSIEAHFLAKGGHGFNMGDRFEQHSINKWPELLKNWMIDSGWTVKKD